MATAFEIVRYGWKPGSRVPVPAPVAGPYLEELRAAQGGTLTPRAVVTAAADAGSPLHPAFEWDDGRAATAWREEQAGHILRSLVVEYRVERAAAPAVTRAYEVVTLPARPLAEPGLPEPGRAYVPVQAALAEPAWRDEVLAQATRELRAWQARYRSLRGLVDVIASIDRALATLDPAS